MTDPYYIITGNTKGNWTELLEKIGLLNVFKAVIENFKEDAIITGIIRYILWTYSIKSERLVIGMESLANKNRIFEACSLPTDLYQSVVLLQNENVLQSIAKWLDYQDNEVFTQLTVLKDLKIEMQLSAISPLKRGTEIDYDQKFKNAQYAKELRKMIQDLENELIQNTPKLKDLYKEVKAIAKKNTTGIEHFVK